MSTSSSPNHQTIEFLIHYLLLSNPEQAVMLTGGWGCGKTWQVRNTIEPRAEANGYKVVYVTLLGLRDVAALQERVAAPLLGTLFADQRTGGAISAAAPEFLERIGFGGTAKNLRTLQKFGSIAGDWVKDHALKKALEGKLLLVFDDLERCSIPIDDMLGYFSSLIGRGSSRVLVISNEDMAKEKSNYYESIKEKLVSHTLRIHADVPGFLKSIIEGWPEGDFKTELLAKRPFLTTILIRVEEPNLRAVRVALTNCSLLFKEIFVFSLPSDQAQKVQETKSWLFELCFSATMFKRMTMKTGKDYLGRFGMRGAFAALASNNTNPTKDLTQSEIFEESLFKKISGGSDYMENPPSFLSALIDDGRLDRVEIINYLAAEFRVSRTQLERDLHLVGNGMVISLSDQEAISTINRVFIALTSGDVKDPLTFISSSSKLFENAGSIWKAPKDLLEQLVDAAQRCVFEATQPLDEVSPYWVAEIAPIKKALNINIVNRINEVTKARVKEVFDKRGSAGVLEEMVTQDNDPGFHCPILAHLDAKIFWPSLAASGNEAIYKAQQSIGYRINRGYILRVPKDDEEWLLASIPTLETMIAEREISPSRHLLQFILDMLLKTKAARAASALPSPVTVFEPTDPKNEEGDLVAEI